MPRSSNAQTWSKRVGASSSRSSTCGTRCPHADSPTTRPAPGGPSRLMNCSKRTAAHGAGRAKRKSTSADASPCRSARASSRRGARVDREIRILPDAAAVAVRAAQEFVQAAAAAVRAKGSFTVALSGGSTPKALYSLLVSDPALRSQVPWDKIHLFFGDERHVPPDHPDSNFRMAMETMISKAPLKPEQVTRIKGEYSDAEQAALEYEKALREYFKLKDGEYPRFDLLLAGMGNEGHTLSLFPCTKALHADGRLVVRNWIGKLYTERITLTAAAASNSAEIIFMVTGADQAPALAACSNLKFEISGRPCSHSTIANFAAAHRLRREKWLLR